MKYLLVLVCAMLLTVRGSAQDATSASEVPAQKDTPITEQQEAATPNEEAGQKKYVEDTDFWLIKRRLDQSRTDPAYVAAPIAANIPGIGFTYGFMGAYFNALDTEADFYMAKFWGDLDGMGTALVDVPLFWEHLTGSIFYNRFQKVAFDTHRRGIDSDPDKMTRVVSNLYEATVGQLSLRLFEKRFQAHYSVNSQRARATKLLDKDGDKIADTDGEVMKSFNRSYGAIFDLTDDRSDPRQGVSIEAQVYDPPRQSADAADFYITDYNLMFYVPMLAQSTWVFNVYKSDAVVTDKGEVDAGEVASDLNFSCDPSASDAEQTRCEAERTQTINETIAAHKYGSATPLGGTQRMRSYVTNRFYAAHALSLGTEFRWNLTQEFTPFNYFVAAGNRTGIQIAAFYELGSVADQESELLKEYVYSIGFGGRLLVASGFIIRLDFAYGNEGLQPSLIFSYPWQVF